MINTQFSNYEQELFSYLINTDLSEDEALGAIFEVRKALFQDQNVAFAPQRYDKTGRPTCKYPDIKQFGDVLIHSDFVPFLQEYGYNPIVGPEDYGIKDTNPDWNDDYGVKDTNPDREDNCEIEENDHDADDSYGVEDSEFDDNVEIE